MSNLPPGVRERDVDAYYGDIPLRPGLMKCINPACEVRIDYALERRPWCSPECLEAHNLRAWQSRQEPLL